MAKQLEFKRVNGWGGKRKQAGRPNKSKTVNHMTRAKVDGQRPLHITHHLKKGVPTIRRKEFLHKFRICARRAETYGLRVIHYVLLYNHIHMIVEADDNPSLARGMRSLVGTFAKAVNHKTKRRGSVFHGRYHMTVVKNPRQMRNTLEYVLLNRYKHDQEMRLDSYSNARDFKHWPQLMGNWLKEMIDEGLKEPPLLDDEWDMPPRSWLARVGWMRAERASIQARAFAG